MTNDYTLKTAIARALSEQLPGQAAQASMAPEFRLPLAAPGLPCGTNREASVLILLYPAEEGLRFPLIRRADSPGPHGGQMALPGGAIDGCEAPERAALRETHEEIGVAPSFIELLGALSALPVIPSGFLVRPFVGWCHERPRFVLSPAEVARIVETGTEELLAPASRLVGEREFAGRRWATPYYRLGGSEVWGATAMILAEFAAVLARLST